MKTLAKYKYYFLLFLTAIALYAQTASYGFVFDDKNLIERNHLIKDTRFISEIFSKEFFNEPGTETGYYRPLINFSFLLEYKIWKLSPTGFHITNILLHAINAILVMLLMQCITEKKKLSFWTAFIYCILPVHTSAVSYIAGRTDLLNTLFTLSSILLFLQYDKTKRYSLLSISLICFLLSLLAKETSILLPIFLSLYFYINKNLKDPLNLKVIASFFITAVIFLIVRSLVTSMPSSDLLESNLFLRLFTINKILFDYLILIIFPHNLHFEKMTEIIPLADITIITALIANMLLLFIFWKIARREKLYFLLGMFFILFMLPTIHIIPIYVQGRLFTAEHFLYMPVIGVLAIFAILLEKFINRYKKSTKPITIILIIWSLFLIHETITTNTTYANNSVFYQHNLKYTPYSIRLLNNYGNHLSAKNKINEAMQQYTTALKENPLHANTLYNTGTLFIKTGDFQKAVTFIEKAIEQNPLRDVFHNNLSVAFSKQNKYRKAIEAQKKALALNPAETDYIYNLGIFSLALKEYKQAREFFTKAAAQSPQSDYFSAIASVDFAEKKYKDALHNNLKAIKLSPHNQEALYNAAICYLTQKNKTEALKYFKKVIAVDPGNVFSQKAAYEISKISKSSKRLTNRHKRTKR